MQLVLTPRGAAVMQKSRRATQSQLARELDTLAVEDQRCVAHAMRLLQSLFSSRPCASGPGEGVDLRHGSPVAAMVFAVDANPQSNDEVHRRSIIAASSE
jgi:hypothetical protein